MYNPIRKKQYNIESKPWSYYKPNKRFSSKYKTIIIYNNVKFF